MRDTTYLKALNNMPAEEQRKIRQLLKENKTGKNTQKKAKKEDEERKPIRETSFFIEGKTLFEQVQRNGENYFVAFYTETEKIYTTPYLELGEEIIQPINGEDVQLGAVRLPTGIEEYGDTLSLLAEIEGFIYRYLDVSSNYLKFAAYYVLLSWLYDRFNTVPYLRALGDTGCGKSRFLDVIGGLCYKPISASGCVTPAPIYRMIRKWQGTLILDEADMKNSDEYNEVVTILNCGFEKGRPVLRATKDNPDKVQVLPVYGPKVFATRRRFKDPALEARCLTEIMQETTRSDIPPVLGRQFRKEQQVLRNKLLLFRLQNYSRVDPETADIDLGDIEPRLRQVSQAFTALFANKQEVLDDYKIFIRGHQQELIEQRAMTKTGQVVNTFFELLEQTTRSPRGVVPFVPNVPDGEPLPVSAGDIAEKLGMRAQAVGQILKGLGLTTKNERAYGERKRYIICDKVKLEALWRRYIPSDLDDDGTSGTSRTYPMGDRQVCSTVPGNSEKFFEDLGEVMELQE